MAKQIRIFSFARFQAILMALLGFACGILYCFVGLLIDTSVTLDLLSSEMMKTPGLSSGSLLAFGSLLGMPIIFATLGFVIGVFQAAVFNLFAKWLPNIKMNF